MQEKLNIKVTIEGVELPLTVNGTEEEKVYRDAAKAIQQRLNGLRKLYPKLPDNYYYVMAMLNTASDAIRTANKASTEPYVEMITDLGKEIEETLAK